MCAQASSVEPDSEGPHETQPSKLLCSWDSLGTTDGVGCPPPWDLPNPGIYKLLSSVSPALAGFFTTEPPGKPG